MTNRLAFAFAVSGAVLVLLLTVLGGAVFPGYSHTAHFISELGARNAPHEMLVRFGGFLPAGLCICVFALTALLILPRGKNTILGLLGLVVYALGYIVAALAPCDPGCRPAEPSLSQLIHNVFGLAGYIAAPFSLITLGLSARTWPGGHYLAPVGFAAATLALVGLFTLSPESPYVGLSQRAIEVAVLLWVCTCAWYLRRTGA
ncbi:MAG: DUF998 domain-containing protein [Candidatus Latescibacteria bacterium]|nr:DUF998 domain-containing protein [Candidatus Latescibacterota bacterium]